MYKILPRSAFFQTLIILLFQAFFVVQSAQANSNDIHDLASVLNPVSSFQADFSQQVIDDSGELVEEYRGQLWVKRPGKLYWHAQQPFAQILTSDNKQIWFYDADLKQVTIRKANNSLTQTPALILSGDVAALDKHFKVKKIITKANPLADQTISRFLLTPKSANSLFESLSLVVKGNNLYQLSIRDSLKQQTKITLSNLKTNVSIDDAKFKFKAPKGVKVIHDEQHTN